MKKLYFDRTGFAEALQALYDRAPFPPEAETAAANMIAAVRKEGDAALFRFAKQFDRVDLDKNNIIVSKAEIDEACRKVSAGDKRAIRQAFEQIKVFAKATRPIS